MKKVRVTVRYPHIHGFSKRTVECKSWEISPQGRLKFYNKTNESAYLRAFLIFNADMWVSMEDIT